MKVVNSSKVEYIDHMGNDNSVVNAARVSFDKVSENYSEEQNARLISYLARHDHWSPFAHTSIQFCIAAPLFVARQLVKHQVGGVWNEVSRRYVDDEPVFYFPDTWRKRAESVKQGSSDEAVQLQVQHGFDVGGLEDTPLEVVGRTLETYEELLRQGVAPEQARMILPQNMMTTWYWTGSLLFFNRVYKLRTDSHAQKETQDVAKQIGVVCGELFPKAWGALNEKAS